MKTLEKVAEELVCIAQFYAFEGKENELINVCLLYTSPSPRD